MRSAGIEGDYPDTVAGLKASFVAMAPTGYVLPTLEFGPKAWVEDFSRREALAHRAAE